MGSAYFRRVEVVGQWSDGRRQVVDGVYRRRKKTHRCFAAFQESSANAMDRGLGIAPARSANATTHADTDCRNPERRGTGSANATTRILAFLTG